MVYFLLIVRQLLPLSAALLFALGCGGNGQTMPMITSTDANVVSCEKDPRIDGYVANLTKMATSGQWKVTLLQSDPGPPIKGINNWMVKVEDAAGNPMSNAALAATPCMPDHGHGTSVHAVVTPQSNGTTAVMPLYLFMAGVWRVSFTIDANDPVLMSSCASPVDPVNFFFCIEG